MFLTTALVAILITSACPCQNGQCLVPFQIPTVQPPSLQMSPPASVVRVINRGQNSSSLGSGTIIVNDAQRAIVLTCAHLFCDGVGNLSVRFPDGHVAEARLLAMDRQWDLAAMAIAPINTVRPPPLASEAPKQGEPLSSCGYGPNGTFLVNRGVVRGYVRAAGTMTFETLEMTGSARQGDSGGPILNQAGELVAVLWGSDGQTVGGTYCGRIRHFLARILGRDSPSPTNEGPPSSAPPFSIGSSLLPETPGVSDGVVASGDEQGSEKASGKVLERLTQLSGSVSKVRTHLESLTDRLERIERVSAKIQSLGLLEKGTTSEAWLPAVMTALGWTVPPSLALMIGLRLTGRILRRRVRKKKDGKESDSIEQSDEVKTAAAATTEQQDSSSRTINDDYGRQLAQVYSLSGRSAIGDVTLGREYDEELRQAESSSDTRLAQWASALRRRVADRFNRIHNSSPTPADPLEQ